MRIDSRVNDMLFRTAQIQNRNFEKVVAEAKNIKKNEAAQKIAAEKHLRASEANTEKKDVVNPEIKANEQFKIYSNDGTVEENKVQEASKLDVRV